MKRGSVFSDFKDQMKQEIKVKINTVKTKYNFCNSIVDDNRAKWAAPITAESHVSESDFVHCLEYLLIRQMFHFEVRINGSLSFGEGLCSSATLNINSVMFLSTQL